MIWVLDLMCGLTSSMTCFTVHRGGGFFSHGMWESGSDLGELMGLRFVPQKENDCGSELLQQKRQLLVPMMMLLACFEEEVQ